MLAHLSKFVVVPGSTNKFTLYKYPVLCNGEEGLVQTRKDICDETFLSTAYDVLNIGDTVEVYIQEADNSLLEIIDLLIVGVDKDLRQVESVISRTRNVAGLRKAAAKLKDIKE